MRVVTPSASSTGTGEAATFWVGDIAAALARLNTTPQGLSTVEAAARLARYGANSAARATRVNVATKLLRRLTEPLIAILLLAAIVSGATGDWTSCAIIVAIVLCSTGLDIFQEQKAEAIVDALAPEASNWS